MIHALRVGVHAGRKLAFAVGILAVISGCRNYEFTFNDRPIYTPEPLFSDYRFTDSALKECVRQTIKDQQVTAVTDLTVLVCTSAGITSLEGLARFSQLQQLNLANNAITDVQELTQLTQLTRIDLSNNAVRNVAVLMTLASLEQLDVSGNPALDCSGADELQANSNAEVSLPEHCR